MLNTPFSPWPAYSAEEVEAATRVLQSNRVNYWTGEECRQFEKEFAKWTGTNYAVALANGTLALELALRGLGVGAGDEVIVTPRSFVASAASVVAVGARPVFADVDANSQNLTADTIMPALTDRTRAVLCVHLAGMPCDMDPIMGLASERDLYVIEDCAQAHGAEYRGRSVGSIGHVGAWSFCQDKIMTTGGEGGMITTNDADVWSRIWSYKDHGKSWDAVYNRDHPAGFRWQHESFGTNARMLEMQAAIGRVQLHRMSDWKAHRVHNAQRLANVCASHRTVRVPVVPDHSTHAYYRFYAFVCPQRLADGWSRDRIVSEVNARGVPCYHGSCSEIYLEAAFSNELRPAHRLPIARELGETSLSLLVHPTLAETEIDLSCDVLDTVLAQAAA